MTALTNGFYAVPRGKVATIVTHMEMRAPFQFKNASMPEGVMLRPLERDVDIYRALHRRIGEEWLWSDRLRMPHDRLAGILTDPATELFALHKNRQDEALLELDFSQPDACEIAYFGLTRTLIGTGAGKALMREAIDRAWSRPIHRLWVHTCTLDSPQALGFYRSCGFMPFAQEVEIADDPRALGVHQPEHGPHIPYLPADK
ncbi:MAG: GNAT family N-acetyltransferase [Roseobacter sp.]